MTIPGSLSLSTSGVSPAKLWTSIASYWMKPPTRPVFQPWETQPGLVEGTVFRNASNSCIGDSQQWVEGAVCNILYNIMIYDISIYIYIYCVFGVISYIGSMINGPETNPPIWYLNIPYHVVKL